MAPATGIGSIEGAQIGGMRAARAEALFEEITDHLAGVSDFHDSKVDAEALMEEIAEMCFKPAAATDE